MIDGEEDLTAVLSTVSCELYYAFDHWNWVGFHRRIDERTLKVGPDQGGHGCLTIDRDRGACLRKKSILLVKEVSKVKYHLACSSETKSEIVLPIIDNSSQHLTILVCKVGQYLDQRFC